MPRDKGVSTALIAFTVTIGALALITPLALRLILEPGSNAEASAASPTRIRAVRRLDLDSKGLAHPGGCGVGEFGHQVVGRLVAAHNRAARRSAGLRHAALLGGALRPGAR